MNRAASTALFEEQVKDLKGELLESRHWTVFSMTYPLLDIGFEGEGRMPFRVQMNCEDWNEQPPWITLLDFDGKILPTLPSGSPSNIFNSGQHNITQRPFICMAGSREYHTHTSHVGDSWENYKSRTGFDLGGIMTQIWGGWLKSRP